MRTRCSTCGQAYPEAWGLSTCRICGGLIERDCVAGSIRVKEYMYDEFWYEWREKMLSTPPRFLTEDDWIDTCAEFNGCALCGFPDVEEKLLVVPTYAGGKLYTFNVIPTCRECALKVRTSQSINPLKTFFTIKDFKPELVEKVFSYLESVMLHEKLEDFDFDQDSLNIIVTITEDTSVKPFNGIWVRKIFKAPKRLNLPLKHTLDPVWPEEVEGVSWKLI